MARPLRIDFAGAVYHVMSRGNERRAIVRDDRDRRTWLDWVRRTVETYDLRLHAFVLMTNHYHLFVETPLANLSAAMHGLNGSYASYFNRRHERAGHLWQGRFKAHLIEREGHWLEVSRYMHLNPSRAGMVKKPEDYAWSSYPGYHWASRALSWLTYATVLGEFGRDPATARREYRRFLRAGISGPPESPWRHAVEGLIVGSDGFVQEVRRRLSKRQPDPWVPELRKLRDRPPLGNAIHAVAQALSADEAQWGPGRRANDLARAMAAYVCRHRLGYSATAVAQALGYSQPSSVTRAVQRIQDSRDRKLKKRIDQIAKRIGQG